MFVGFLTVFMFLFIYFCD
jgi:hypothetical protein